LITRGVLIDVAAVKGVPMLGDTYEITPQDLQAALTAQKLTLQPGDAVLIHTGWGTLWGKDNVRYQRSSPGLGVAAAEWLAKQDPMLVGADNSAVEVTPNPDKNLAGPGHQIFLVVNGIHLLENLRLDELAARRAHEFAGRGAAEDSGRDGIDRGADCSEIDRVGRVQRLARPTAGRGELTEQGASQWPARPAVRPVREDRPTMKRLLMATASTPNPISTKPITISMSGPLRSSPKRSLMKSPR